MFFALARVPAVLFVTVSLAGAAEETLLKLAMPDAAVLAGINVDRIKNTPLGKTILSRFKSGNKDVQELIDRTGFDPGRDVQEILIAAPTVNGKNSNGLMLLRGKFDPARFTQFPQFSAASYRGVTVLTSKEKEPMAVACLSPAVLALGDPASVRAAIARRAQSGGVDVKLAATARDLRGKLDIWVASILPVSDLAGTLPKQEFGGALQGDVLKGIRQASGGLKFGPTLQITAELVARSEKDAAALGDVIRFFAGMLRAHQTQGNEAARALDNLQLSARGDTVKLALAIPEDQLAKMFASSVARMTAARPAAAKKTAPKTAGGGLVIQSSPKDMGTVKIP